MNVGRMIAVVGLLLGAVLGVMTACSSNDATSAADPGGADDAATHACVPGQQTTCACSGGGSGVQVCDASGASFGSCQCAGSDRDADTPDIGDSGGADTGADAPPPKVVVAFKWSYVSIGGGGQCTGAITCAACPGLTQCTCAGGSLPNRPASCCSGSATIVETDISKLVQDYPGCTLGQTSPTTYSLECPAPSAKYDGVTQVEGIKYINQCSWLLPYALP